MSSEKTKEEEVKVKKTKNPAKKTNGTSQESVQAQTYAEHSP